MTRSNGYSSRTVAPRKAEARRRLRQVRAGLTGEELTSRGEALAEALQAHLSPAATVLGYLSMRGEPEVTQFLERQLRRGGDVLVPVTRPGAVPTLEWARWRPGIATESAGPLPLREPVGERLETESALALRNGPSAVLVPALALDSAGARLGQGGGYYDHFTQQLGGLSPALRPELIGVVHAAEVLDPGAFPVEPHDLHVDLILTEQGLSRPVSSPSQSHRYPRQTYNRRGPIPG